MSFKKQTKYKTLDVSRYILQCANNYANKWRLSIARCGFAEFLLRPKH